MLYYAAMRGTEWIIDAHGCEPAALVDVTRLRGLFDALVEARNAARKARNFAESDRLRDELAALGIVLEDGPQGTRWKRK